jgi:activator of 2-hydroxyglutaryl-CoA dehydratase
MATAANAGDNPQYLIVTEDNSMYLATPIHQATPADKCMDKVFTSIKEHYNQTLDDAVTGYESHYTEDSVEAVRYTCEVTTNSHITNASDQYLNQDGYDLVIR